MGNSGSRGGSKDDTKTYRDGYPEETLDDLEEDLNLAFYTNKIASKGWGTFQLSLTANTNLTTHTHTHSYTSNHYTHTNTYTHT